MSDDTKGLHPLSQIARFVGRSGKRIAVTLVGFTVLIAGIIMMVTPGPGILAIIAGLAILASEWAWAERALDRAKVTSKAALETATASPLRIALSITATVAGIVAVLLYFLVIR